MTQIKAAKNALLNLSSITLFFEDELSKLAELDKQQISYFKKELEQQKDILILQELNIWHYYVPVKKEAAHPELLEQLRTKGCQLQAGLNGNKQTEVCVINQTTRP